MTWSFETNAIHGGAHPDPDTGATALPIYQSASFQYDSAQRHSDVFHGREFGYQYSRVTNPSITALEERINALSDGRGTVCTASGMASVSTTLMALTSTGDHIIAAKSLFGGTHYLFRHVLENFGVDVSIVPSTDVSAYERAITDKTKAIFLETIGNPKLDVPDITAIGALAQAHNIPLIVDATTTTPYLFNAKDHGVSILVLSTTKYLSGSGTTVGGSITDLGTFDWTKTRSNHICQLSDKVGNLAFLGRARRQIQSNTGSIMAPMNAFITSLGLDTLALRMEKHSENALQLASYLESHSKVVSANYPGLESNPDHHIAKTQFNDRYSGLLTIRLGSKEHAYTFIDNTRIARTLVNIGDTKTLVSHPQSTIYRDFSPEDAGEIGAFDDLVRISVGIEYCPDLIQDMEQALSVI